MQKKDIDIVRNNHTIEKLKSELLTQIASFYQILANGSSRDLNDEMTDAVSNIILVSYLLSRRLGLNYSDIDRKIQGKIRIGLIENCEPEKYYGDISELAQHFNALLNG